MSSDSPSAMPAAVNTAMNDAPPNTATAATADSVMPDSANPNTATNGTANGHDSHSDNNSSIDGEATGIIFTDNAARKVKSLIDEENNSDLMLRVFIAGGGCSGFQYGFTFDEERAEDDFTLEKMGVTVLVDPMSYQYLVGAQIDYKEGLEGSQFVIRNPNVTSTCGCGSSFSA